MASRYAPRAARHARMARAAGSLRLSRAQIDRETKRVLAPRKRKPAPVRARARPGVRRGHVVVQGPNWK